jgi:hypothetical protein
VLSKGKRAPGTGGTTGRSGKLDRKLEMGSNPSALPGRAKGARWPGPMLHPLTGVGPLRGV